MRVLLLTAALSSVVSSCGAVSVYRWIDGTKAEYPARYSINQRRELNKLVKATNREWKKYGTFKRKH